MKIQFSPNFHKKIKKEDVRIQKSFKEALLLFIRNPLDPEFDNHPLREIWKGYRSIDITGDYRAIYEEVNKGDDVIAYFITIGTHQELYTRDN